MKEKIKDPQWKPDFGDAAVHPTAGVVAVGARRPLVAFNVNLDTDSMTTATAIARAVRGQGGGLRCCRAIAINLRERGIVQVSMNMTDYTRTPLYRALEMVRMEAKRYGVNVIGSEIVGLVPSDALIESAGYYMGLENFTTDQILENKLREKTLLARAVSGEELSGSLSARSSLCRLSSPQRTREKTRPISSPKIKFIFHPVPTGGKRRDLVSGGRMGVLGGKEYGT